MSEIVSFDVKFPPEHAEDVGVDRGSVISRDGIVCRGLQHAAGLLADIEMRYWRTATFDPEAGRVTLITARPIGIFSEFLRFFDRLAVEQPERARAEVGLWPTNEEFFFDKLKIYALMKPNLFSGHECAEGILGLSDEAFWDGYQRRELLHTLRARWVEFPEADRRAIEERILGDQIDGTRKRRTSMRNERPVPRQPFSAGSRYTNANSRRKSNSNFQSCKKQTIAGDQVWDASADHSFGRARRGRQHQHRCVKDHRCTLGRGRFPVPRQHDDIPFENSPNTGHFGLVKRTPAPRVIGTVVASPKRRYPTRLWRSALTDWPEILQIAFDACSHAAGPSTNARRLRLRYYIPQWFRTNFPKLAKAGYQSYLPFGTRWLTFSSRWVPRAMKVAAGRASVGGRPLQRSRRTREHSINAPVGEVNRHRCSTFSTSLKLPGGRDYPQTFGRG